MSEIPPQSPQHSPLVKAKLNRAGVCESLKADGLTCARATLYRYLIGDKLEHRCCKHAPDACSSPYVLKVPSKQCEYVYLKGRRCEKLCRNDYVCDGELTRRCYAHNPIYLSEQRERMNVKYREKRAKDRAAREKLIADIAGARSMQ